MIQLFVLSQRRVVNISNMPYVGLENFRRLFVNDIFPTAITNNLKLLPAVAILLALGSFLAALLNEQMRGWTFYRAIIFLPYILPVPVVGIAFSQMLTRNGVLNTLLAASGLSFLVNDWLGNTSYAIFTIMVVITWKELGFATMLFLARLLSVPRELYEAAAIDGASWWQSFLRISLPELRGIAAILIVLEVFNLLSWVFSYIYTMTAGGPGYSTTVLEFFIYRAAFFWSGELGLASAVCVMLFFAALVSIPVRNRLGGAANE